MRLGDASDEIRDNEDMVLLAVGGNGMALSYASDRINVNTVVLRKIPGYD